MGLIETGLSLLTVTNVLLSLIAYVTFKIVYQIVYYRFFHPLSVFPGPFWASVTRLWIARHAYRGTEYLALHELSKKHGMWKIPRQATLSDLKLLPRPRGAHHPDVAVDQRPFKASRCLSPQFRQDRTLYSRRLQRGRKSVQYETPQDACDVPETHCGTGMWKDGDDQHRAKH